jgi:hypothetical protein
MGHDHDAREILIAKQRALVNRGDTDEFRRLWLRILGATTGFGYRPQRVLAWLLLLVWVGSLVLWSAAGQGQMAPVKDSMSKNEEYLRQHRLPAGYPEFNALFYSLDVALPIIDLHQEAYWAPRHDTLGDRVSGGELVQLWLWAETLFGWLLATIGIAAITGIIKKD